MDLFAIYSDRLRVLKERLGIENCQAFIWHRFEVSVKAALNISPRSVRPLDGLYPSLPTALDHEFQKTQYRVEACRALLESVRALYAVLSDKQRKLADRLLSPVLSEVLAARSDMHDRNLAA